MPVNSSRILVWIVIGAVVLWRLYARLRRTVGRQQFRPRRLRFMLGFYAVASLVVAVFALGHTQQLLGWAAGLFPGIGLGFWSLRLTRFEAPADGHGYTPSAHIGVALYLIFLGRLIYRSAVFYTQFSLTGHPSPPAGRSAVFYTQFSLTGHPPPPAGHSALTDLAFELLAGYFIAYYAGILRRYRAEARVAGSAA